MEHLALHLGGFGQGFGKDLEPLGASWAVFEPLFSMLAFGVVFKVLLEASGLDAGSILRGLGRILGGFWEDFSMFFRFFLKTANFVKYSVLPRKNHYICYVALLKNNKKSTQNHRKSDANLG